MVCIMSIPIKDDLIIFTIIIDIDVLDETKTEGGLYLYLKWSRRRNTNIGYAMRTIS